MRPRLRNLKSISLPQANGRQAPRDLWDKFQAVSQFISTVVIAASALAFTVCYNERQSKRGADAKAHDAKIAEVLLVEKFIPHLTKSDEERKLAFIAMSALGETPIVTKIAALYPSPGTTAALLTISEQAPDPASRSAAQEALGADPEALNLPPPAYGGSRVGRVALSLALADLRAGAREEGTTNRGEWVRKYLKGRDGLPWSAGFVSWCYSEAANQLAVPPPFTYASTFHGIRAQLHGRGRLHLAGSAYVPKPGDIHFVGNTSAP